MKTRLLRKLRKKFAIQVRGNEYRIIERFYDGEYDSVSERVHNYSDLKRAKDKQRNMILNYANRNYWKSKKKI